MKETLTKLKNKLNKIFYFSGITTIVLLLTAIIIKLFIFSSPSDSNENDENYYKEMKKNYIIYSPKIPENIDFCGEKVPLKRFDVKQSLDYELLKVMYWHSETILYIKRMDAVFAVVDPILKKYKIPEDFRYLLVTESGMTNVVSGSHAEGYWQFMKPTALDYGLEINDQVDERYDLQKSTEAACKYLQDSYKLFGNWTLAAASYNVGRDHIKKQLLRQKVNSFYDLLLNIQTSRYLYRILAFKIILSNPREYGFFIRNKDKYKTPPVKILQVNSEIPSLIDFSLHYKTNFKILRKLNPWLRSDKLTNLAGKTYYIKIPK